MRIIDKVRVPDLWGSNRLAVKGGSPIQRMEEDKKGSNEVVMRVNKVGW